MHRAIPCVTECTLRPVQPAHSADLLELANNFQAQCCSWLRVCVHHASISVERQIMAILVISFPSLNHNLEPFISASYLQISKELETCHSQLSML